MKTNLIPMVAAAALALGGAAARGEAALSLVDAAGRSAAVVDPATGGVVAVRARIDAADGPVAGFDTDISLPSPLEVAEVGGTSAALGGAEVLAATNGLRANCISLEDGEPVSATTGAAMLSFAVRVPAGTPEGRYEVGLGPRCGIYANGTSNTCAVAVAPFAVVVASTPPVPCWDPAGGGTTNVCASYTPYFGQNTLTTGWYVVEGALTNGARIVVSGDVNLLLMDHAELAALQGINVAAEGGVTNRLAVWAQSDAAADGNAAGRLVAVSGDGAYAGIGGDRGETAGAIAINGGTVTATGGDFSAGIGGGWAGTGGSITINGGTVEARGGEVGAGIGGGRCGSGGTITINGGTVKASGGDGGGAGIGGGVEGAGGDVTIRGGTVTATSGGGYAAIGGAYDKDDGSLLLDGMKVTYPEGTTAAGREAACRAMGGRVTLEVCDSHEYEDGACKRCGTATGAAADRQMERLTRGVLVSNVGSGVLVSWRLLGTESPDTEFNLYRDGVKIATIGKNDGTNYLDENGKTTSKYKVTAVVDGKEQAAQGVSVVLDKTVSNSGKSFPYKILKLEVPAAQTMPDDETCTYTPNDMSAADLDGDGEYELILKWDPSNSRDNSQGGYTGTVFIDAYKLDGTRLWRIDMGKNIRAGAHYTQFQVYDYDGDGKAEMIVKTADGTIDGTGKAIGDKSKDYRDAGGTILKGPEYLTVFRGVDGAAITTVEYQPSRDINQHVKGKNGKGYWGDNYGNRCERYIAATAYLDGAHPSAIFIRGYYTASYVAAYDFDGKDLKLRWLHKSEDPGQGLYGQGNHNIAVGDIDGDGYDEIVFGGATLSHGGTVRFSTQLGHGDAGHLGDLDPDHPGMEFWCVHEQSDAQYTEEMRGKDGKVYWGTPQPNPGVDNGRGMAADIDSEYRGYEVWSSKGGGMKTAKGQKIGSPSVSTNFRIYFDGDEYDELLDGAYLTKFNSSSKTSEVYFDGGAALGAAGCNGTKNTPSLVADLFGDWREELVVRSETDPTTLYIISTPVTSEHRVYTLMHDATYRVSIAWQNTGYNQPPHVGYYLPDMVKSLQQPNVFLAGEELATAFPDGDIVLTPCEAEYDGAAHTIGVATNAIEGLTLKYAVAGDGRFEETSLPEFVNATNATVFVEASAPGYLTATNSVTVTITPAPLTITAKDQTLDYDGMPKGENNTAYETSEEIAAKVEAEGLKGNDRIASVKLDGRETAPGTYTNRLVASGAQIYNGTNNVTGNYAISYVAGTLTVREVVHTVTFTWHGGSFATNYLHGTTLTAPETPAPYTDGGTNYGFAGWSPEVVTVVTNDAAYTARYLPVPNLAVSCVVDEPDGGNSVMFITIAGPADCDGWADVAVYQDGTLEGTPVWSTNGVRLAGGKADFTVSPAGDVMPGFGQHVLATYHPSGQYAGATVSNRVMGTSSINMIISLPIDADSAFSIRLSQVNSTGDIGFTLRDGNSAETAYTVVSNAVVFPNGLSAGDYVATAVLAGDEDFLGSACTNAFHVGKYTPTMGVTATDAYEGETVVVAVALNADAAGRVKVQAGGQEYGGSVVAGRASVEIAGLATGNYSATVEYTGDERYFGAATNVEFTVSPMPPERIWFYTQNGDGETATVTGIATNYAKGDLVMPDTLGGLRVTAVGDRAFVECTNITGMAIAAGVTDMGEEAFSGCTGLTDMTIPDLVTDIGAHAFDGCGSLTNVWLGTGIAYVGENAFSGCNNLATIWIPVEQRGTELLTDAGLQNGCDKHYYGKQVVKFDENGGTSGVKTHEYTIGEAYGWLPVTWREGYDFTGWWDEAEGVLLTTNAIVTEFASRTVYARWVQQAVLTVEAGRWGSAVAVIGGTTNTVAGGTTAKFRVPNGSRVEMRAVADAGFAVDGEGSVEIASFSGNVSVAFAFRPNPVDAAIRWKFSSAIGRYFAQVSIPAHAGYAEALEGLAFLFADRTNAVGEVYAQLWDATARSAQGVLVTNQGVEYRGVALDAAAFDGLAEDKSALWGVSDETLADARQVVPASDRLIGLYMRKRVSPESGNEAADEVQNFFGYLTWTTRGTRYYLPIVEGGTNAVMETQPSQSSTVASETGSGQTSASFYNVVFAANGGTGVMAAQTIAGGAKATLRPCAYKRTGWLFLGWAKTKNGAVAYKDEASVRNLAKNGKTVTLYAKWAKKTYKVVFCRTYKSAKGKMKKQTFTYGTGKKLRKNKFTREGYVFKGWAKSKALAKKGKVAYKNRKKVKNLVTNGKTVKLYAVWKKE